MRTRIKICGLTREQDIDACVDAGADAIGFVFYAKSKRCLTVARAAELRKRVPAFVSVVALFVNATREEVRAVQTEVQPELLQFHGDESPEECRSYGQRYMKAFRVGGPGLETAADVLAACRQYDDAAAWLFDSYTAQYGGSGVAFDSALLDDVLAADDARAVVLSGGLKVETVGQVVQQLKPWGVDVSSGVEDSPGMKDRRRISEFFAEFA